MKTGGNVNAVLDAYPDWTIPASVIAIVPTANREKATVKVRIGLKHKDPRILPDMAVKVTFLEEVSAPGARPQELTRRELTNSSNRSRRRETLAPDTPMVRLAGLSKGFVKGKETISIFDHLDLAIPRGDFVAVMGPSGSGKTTLLNLLGGIDRPTRARSMSPGSASTTCRRASSRAFARPMSASSSSSTI